MKVLAIFAACLLCQLINGQSVEDDGRIVLGSNATLGQFPYQALLRSNNGTVCGASLIHVRWFLTGAHCIKANHVYLVRVGSIIFDQGIAYPARKIIVHPSYVPSTLDYDVAMIKTDTVLLNQFVKLIALPTSIFPNNATVVLSGWGRTSGTSGVSTVLQWTTARSSSLCGTLPAWKMCVKVNNAGGVCFGDSGGPAASGSTTVAPVLQGVSSYIFSPTCALNLPSVSARVSFFVPWINNIIATQ